MVQCSNGLLYIQLHEKLSEFIWCEICAYILHYFPWKPKFWKHNLNHSYQVVNWKAIFLLYKRKFTVVIYNAHLCIIFIVNTLAPTTTQAVWSISYGIIFSSGCLCWYSIHVAHCFTVFPMPVFIFIQFTDSHAQSLIFSIPMWLLYKWCRISFCNRKGNITLLPFMTMSSITSSSPLIS